MSDLYPVVDIFHKDNWEEHKAQWVDDVNRQLTYARAGDKKAVARLINILGTYRRNNRSLSIHGSEIKDLLETICVVIHSNGHSINLRSKIPGMWITTVKGKERQTGNAVWSVTSILASLEHYTTRKRHE